MRQAGLVGVRHRALGLGSVALHVGTRPAEATLAIRRARPEDGPTVRDIVFATLRAYGITPDPDGLDADVVAFGRAGDGPVLELVAELDGRVVGSVVVSARENGEAWLSKLFVDAAVRGRGIGRALLDRAEAEARSRGSRRLRLETRTIYREAVRLYEANGWQRGPDLPPEHGPDRSYFLDL
jgi:putative acetyltransferase